MAVRARGRRGECAYYLPLAPNGKGINLVLATENAFGGPDIPELAKIKCIFSLRRKISGCSYNLSKITWFKCLPRRKDQKCGLPEGGKLRIFDF
jgi:hypothetical protein